MEADRSLLDKLSNAVHMRAGSIKALKTAISAVRRGGTVTVVDLYGMPYDNFPVGQIFDIGIKMAFGQAPVQKYIDELVDWVMGRKIRLDDIITHRLEFSEAPHGYEIFRKKQDNCVKNCSETVRRLLIAEAHFRRTFRVPGVSSQGTKSG